MNSKRRLTQVILLLLSGVSLCSILFMAGVWVAEDVRDSRRQVRDMEGRFQRDWRESLSSEVQKVAGYISEASSEEELNTLLRVKGRTEEVLATLSGAVAEDPGIASDPEKRAALAAMLRYGSFAGGLERFVLVDLATGRLLAGAASPEALDGGEGQEAGESGEGEGSEESGGESPGRGGGGEPAGEGQDIAAEGYRIADEEGFRRIIESVSVLGAAFYRWDFASGGAEEGGESLCYLAVFEPLGWAVGTLVRPEAFAESADAELVSWAGSQTLPEGMTLALLSYEGDVLSATGGLEAGNVYARDDGAGMAEAASRMIRGARSVGSDFLSFDLLDPETGEKPRALGYYKALSDKEWVAAAWVLRSLLDRGIAAEREELGRLVNRSVLRAGLITASMLALIIAISRYLAGKASRSFSSFFTFFERASSTSVLLSPEEQPFLEFALLAEAANRMIEVRERAEELLRFNEARFRAIFEVSPQAICVLDRRGTLLEANSHFPSMSGIELADAVGKPLGELMGPAAEAAACEAASAGADCGSGAGAGGARRKDAGDGPGASPGSDGDAAAGREIEFTRPDGKAVTLLFLGASLKLPSEDRILGIFIDVTGQRAAERERSLLRERLGRAQTMETLGVMASETAHELNNILSGITGYPELLMREGGLSDRQLAYVQEILAAGARAADVVGDLMTLAQGVAVKSEKLDLNAIVREILSDPAGLAAPTGPGRGALQAALRQAGPPPGQEGSSAAQGGAAPGIPPAVPAPEGAGATVKSPPTGGAGAAGTPPAALDGPGSPAGAPDSSGAARDGAAAAAGEGAQPAAPRPVPEAALSPKPLWVEAGRMRLKKTVLALISNAVNAAALSPDEARRRVKVETAASPPPALPPGGAGAGPGESALLRVTDGGPGIPPEDQAKIFDPFYTGRHWGGRGLGLTLAANTVKALGGALDFATGPEGTVFSMRLPLAAPPAKAARKGAGMPAGLEAWKGKGERVLIVDDVDIQRNLAGKMLKNLGYEPAAASSGEEAIEYLQSHEADLILLDMIMRPGINGRETYERVLAFKPAQKAVIASGMAEGEEVEKARALGASHFIMKPYSIAELAKVLRQALSGPSGGSRPPADPPADGDAPAAGEGAGERRGPAGGGGQGRDAQSPQNVRGASDPDAGRRG
ncbi:MAG: response regulator [Deltaproteobacteria bacterium]|jgi:signal transduction histidine kinase/ActR/RegA family two-component response regulator|nr:response regulator [Deltaproteobacteria bacterium]